MSAAVRAHTRREPPLHCYRPCDGRRPEDLHLNGIGDSNASSALEGAVDTPTSASNLPHCWRRAFSIGVLPRPESEASRLLPLRDSDQPLPETGSCQTRTLTRLHAARLNAGRSANK